MDIKAVHSSKNTTLLFKGTHKDTILVAWNCVAAMGFSYLIIALLCTIICFAAGYVHMETALDKHNQGQDPDQVEMPDAESEKTWNCLDESLSQHQEDGAEGIIEKAFRCMFPEDGDQVPEWYYVFMWNELQLIAEIDPEKGRDSWLDLLAVNKKVLEEIKEKVYYLEMGLGETDKLVMDWMHDDRHLPKEAVTWKPPSSGNEIKDMQDSLTKFSNGITKVINVATMMNETRTGISNSMTEITKEIATNTTKTRKRVCVLALALLVTFCFCVGCRKSLDHNRPSSPWHDEDRRSPPNHQGSEQHDGQRSAGANRVDERSAQQDGQQCAPANRVVERSPRGNNHPFDSLLFRSRDIMRRSLSVQVTTTTAHSGRAKESSTNSDKISVPAGGHHRTSEVQANSQNYRMDVGSEDRASGSADRSNLSRSSGGRHGAGSGEINEMTGEHQRSREVMLYDSQTDMDLDPPDTSAMQSTRHRTEGKDDGESGITANGQDPATDKEKGKQAGIGIKKRKTQPDNSQKVQPKRTRQRKMIRSNAG